MPEGTTPIDIVTADGSVASVPDELVSRLVGVASRLGLRSGDLEEAVHDCCEYAAERLLAGSARGVAPSLVYRCAGAVADHVNGAGLRTQVAFLAHHHGTEHHTTVLLADLAERVRAHAHESSYPVVERG
jgi:hypothetical protein